MRSAFALGLSIVFCASANAATVYHPHRAHHNVIVRPSQGVTAPVHFAVPGWSNEETQYWLDNATSCAGCG
jgi:hypothetical protein